MGTLGYDSSTLISRLFLHSVWADICQEIEHHDYSSCIGVSIFGYCVSWRFHFLITFKASLEEFQLASLMKKLVAINITEKGEQIKGHKKRSFSGERWERNPRKLRYGHWVVFKLHDFLVRYRWESRRDVWLPCWVLKGGHERGFHYCLGWLVIIVSWICVLWKQRSEWEGWEWHFIHTKNITTSETKTFNHSDDDNNIPFPLIPASSTTLHNYSAPSTILILTYNYLKHTSIINSNIW